MDRNKVRNLRDALEKTLVQFSKDNGVVARIGNAKFSLTSVEFKVELAETAANGTVMSKEATAYTQLAESYGLPKDGLGKSFRTLDGNIYIIKGLNTRAHKMPVLACDAQGKMYKFSEYTVRNGLLNATPKAKRSEAEILADLKSVECALSPENLSCDGELPYAAVAARHRMLAAERKNLVAELGRDPLESELYPQMA